MKILLFMLVIFLLVILSVAIIRVPSINKNSSADQAVEEGKMATSSWNIYNNLNYQYKISYPKDYSVTEYSDINLPALKGSLNRVDFSINNSPDISINVHNNKTFKNCPEWADYYRTQADSEVSEITINNVKAFELESDEENIYSYVACMDKNSHTYMYSCTASNNKNQVKNVCKLIRDSITFAQ